MPRPSTPESCGVLAAHHQAEDALALVARVRRDRCRRPRSARPVRAPRPRPGRPDGHVAGVLHRVGEQVLGHAPAPGRRRPRPSAGRRRPPRCAPACGRGRRARRRPRRRCRAAPRRGLPPRTAKSISPLIVARIRCGPGERRAHQHPGGLEVAGPLAPAPPRAAAATSSPTASGPWRSWLTWPAKAARCSLERRSSRAPSVSRGQRSARGRRGGAAPPARPSRRRRAARGPPSSLVDLAGAPGRRRTCVPIGTPRLVTSWLAAYVVTAPEVVNGLSRKRSSQPYVGHDVAALGSRGRSWRSRSRGVARLGQRRRADDGVLRRRR